MDAFNSSNSAQLSLNSLPQFETVTKKKLTLPQLQSFIQAYNQIEPSQQIELLNKAFFDGKKCIVITPTEGSIQQRSGDIATEIFIPANPLEKAIEELRKTGSIENLAHVPEELLKNQTYMLEALKIDIEAMKFASKVLLHDTSFLLEAIKINLAALNYVPESLRQKEALLVKILDVNSQAVDFILPWIQTKSALIVKSGEFLAAKIKAACQLSILEDREKESLTCAFESYFKLTQALKAIDPSTSGNFYASMLAKEIVKKLVNESELVLRIITLRPKVFKFASNDLRHDKVFIAQAILQNSKISDELETNQYQNIQFLDDIFIEFQKVINQKLELADKAQCIKLFKDLKTYLDNIRQKTGKSNRKYLESLSEEIFDLFDQAQDKELVKEMVAIEPYCLHLIEEPLLNDTDFFAQLAIDNLNLIHRFPSVILNNEFFWIPVLKNYLSTTPYSSTEMEIFLYASNQLKKDKVRLIPLIKISQRILHCVDQTLIEDAEFEKSCKEVGASSTFDYLKEKRKSLESIKTV